MALALGIFAALFLGASDIFAARASRHVASIAVARTAFVSAAVVAAVLLLFIDSTWELDDVLIGAASGAFLGVALAILYHGYATATIGLVAPISSVLLATVPVLDDLRRGNSLKAIAWVGVALGLLAIVLATYERGGTGDKRAAVVYGITSGIGFGIGFTLLAATSDESGIAPVLMQRAGAMVLLTLAMVAIPGPWLAVREPGRTPAILCGALAGAAMVALQLGFRSGSQSVVSVTSSQFATVAVLLAVTVNNERLRRTQVAGLLCAAVAVAFMAL